MTLDYYLFQLINQFAGKYPMLDQFMVIFTTYGPLIFGIILVWIWFSKDDNKDINRKAVILAVIAAGLALFINQIITHFYFRPRPFSSHIVHLLIDKSTDPSFPSDHATGAFSLAITILFFNKKVGWKLLFLAILLSLSRIFVGTHYPLDILGGLSTGVVGSITTIWQSKRLEPVTNWIIKIWGKIEGKSVKRALGK